jgi:hypothetical protein
VIDGEAQDGEAEDGKEEADTADCRLRMVLARGGATRWAEQRFCRQTCGRVCHEAARAWACAELAAGA